jgi:rare lipoprotein A
MLAVCLQWSLACAAWTPSEAAPAESGPRQPAPTTRLHRREAGLSKPDLTGRKRVGKASIYDLKNHKMADGTPMNPQSNSAASKTLPLGTKAKVTNLDTGQTAVVTIRDRGPYVPGRIVDISPATATQIGLSPKQGVANVAVAPITVPLPDGGAKIGEAGKAGPPQNPRPH